MAVDCLFCGIASGTVPATIVQETDRTVAFRDINPQAPVHVLVITKPHYQDIAELAAADPELTATLLRAAADAARAEGLDGSGFRLVFNTGAGAHQTVFHVHVHVLGGRSMTWPPG